MSVPSHAAIITAAGSSLRFHHSLQQGCNERSLSATKKEFFLLGTHSVLYHATLPFLSIPSLHSIVITHAQGRKEETEQALDTLLHSANVPIVLIEGGATRQQSVYKALSFLTAYSSQISYVAIHDGARPWVTSSLILSTLQKAIKSGGAAPVLALHDALKRVDHQGNLIDHIDRSSIVAIQTPQVFSFSHIVAAHKEASRKQHSNYVDDTHIFTDFGGIVGTVPGDPLNRKITVVDDLKEFL